MTDQQLVWVPDGAGGYARDSLNAGTYFVEPSDDQHMRPWPIFPWDVYYVADDGDVQIIYDAVTGDRDAIRGAAERHNGAAVRSNAWRLHMIYNDPPSVPDSEPLNRKWWKR